MNNADGIRRLRDLTGFGMTDCRRAFETADACGGDVLVALAVLHRAGLAIHRKDDRDAWNLSGAPEQAAVWRAEIEGLADAFPRRPPCPRPETAFPIGDGRMLIPGDRPQDQRDLLPAGD